MSHILPPLASLRAFDAVARFGSVKIASESLNLTPSAISHQVRALEAHFGVQLVKPNGRSIVLTEMGSVYATAVMNAFNELFRASDQLETRRHDKIVRVSVTPTFATLAALPNLAKFRTTYPNIDLRIEARNTPVNFENDPIDAAVQLGTPPFPDLIFHRLLHSRNMPCVERSLIEKYGPIRDAKDLARMPLIEFATAPGSWRGWFNERAPELSSIEPELLGDSLLTGIQMARSGMGAILAPFPLVSSMITSGALTAISLWPPMPLGERDFYFTYRKLDAASEKIKVVHNWLKLTARSLETEAAKLGF